MDSKILLVLNFFDLFPLRYVLYVQKYFLLTYNAFVHRSCNERSPSSPEVKFRSCPFLCFTTNRLDLKRCKKGIKTTGRNYLNFEYGKSQQLVMI